MIFLLLSLFAISLIYLAFFTRVKRYIAILSFQGVLLTLLALVMLENLSFFHLFSILLETLIVKALAIPLFLDYLRKRNNLKNTSQSRVLPFFSVLIISATMVLCFFLSHRIQGYGLQKEIFAVSLVCMVSGLLFIVTHINLFTHLVGYLVLENGVFLLSLAIGGEMPILVNLAILLDIFVGVLVLGIFLNRIGDTYNKVEAEELLMELVD